MRMNSSSIETGSLRSTSIDKNDVYSTFRLLWIDSL